jgi:RNA polymerase sigma factor (sigma-70 family)
MHSSTLRNVLEHLRRLADPIRSLDLSDADLLERFRLRREEAAFTLLVQRHGPMVLAVCRRVLGDVHEAEDAFQTTFLVLVRNAAAIRKQQSLAAWLHGVASRVAHKSRTRSARRCELQHEVDPPAVYGDPSETFAAEELRTALDEEVERLPAKYRTPLVLCYLADKTHEQAALELGWPKSSVTARLARARELLQRRLRMRGFTGPAALLAALLTEQSANAALPSLLTLSTVRLAVQALTGETLATTSAAAFAGSFIKSTAMLKLGAMLALLAALGFAAVGYRMAVPGSLSSLEQPAGKGQAPGQSRGAKSESRKPRVDVFGDPLPDEAVARIGSMRLRHGAPIRRLAFSGDGKSLVSGAIGSICIWDIAAGKSQRRINFDAATESFLEVVFRSDGILVASAGEDKKIVTLRLVDPAGGRVRRRMDLPAALAISQPVLSRDGKRIAFSTDKNFVRIYDAATGRETLRMPVHGNGIPSLAFSPDGKTIAFQYSETDTVHLYDAINGKKLCEFTRERDSLSRPVFSPDGRFLASVSFLRIGKPGELTHVTVWDVATGKERHRLQSTFGDIVFSPDSKTLAIGCQNGEIIFWDMASGKEVRRFLVQDLYVGFAFSPDSKVLAVSCGGGTIRLSDAATGQVLPASADPSLDMIFQLRFSGDSKRLIGHGDKYIAWEPGSGREIRRFAKVPAPRWRLPLSPDESLLASAEENGTICLHDAQTGKVIRTLKGHKKYLWNMIFCVGGRRLISSSADGTIRLWDVASGRELSQLNGGGDRTMHLAISPDDRWLASASDSRGTHGHYEIVLWDLVAAKERTRFTLAGNNHTCQIAFSPDGRLLAAGGGGRRLNEAGTVQIWNIATGNQRSSFDGHKSYIYSIAFSADGRMLATGDTDGSLSLWELASNRKRHEFVGHENQIFSLAFSPNGRMLAASSYDVPAYVWDVAGTIERPLRTLSSEELRCFWATLASEDAAAAFQAIRHLAAAPEQTLPFLRRQLKPVSAPDQKRIRQLVDMLDSADFSVRQKASEQLEKQADAAAGLLRQIMTKESPSLEVRRRLQPILENIENNSESLRVARAVEVLEWIGTPDAVKLLGELANGAGDARLTREASAAIRRVRR